MNFRKYSEEQLREAVSSSVSYRQVLQKISLAPKGGNYKTLQKAISLHKLDTSHFTGKNLTGRQLPPRRRPMEDYLSNKVPIQSNKLRKYLLEEGVFKASCSNCSLTQWLENPIPLELDHIDGNFSNNELKNLRLLCPNCHALTSTYRGRNIGNLARDCQG